MACQFIGKNMSIKNWTILENRVKKPVKVRISKETKTDSMSMERSEVLRDKQLDATVTVY